MLFDGHRNMRFWYLPYRIRKACHSWVRYFFIWRRSTGLSFLASS